MKKLVSLAVLLAILLSTCVFASGCGDLLGTSGSLSAAQKIFESAGCFEGVSQEEVELAVGEAYTLADTKIGTEGNKTLYYSVQIYGLSALLICDFFEDALTNAYIETTATKAGVRQVGKGMAEEAIAAQKTFSVGDSNDSASANVIIIDIYGNETLYSSIEAFNAAWPSVRIEDVASVNFYADAANEETYNDTFYVVKQDIDKYQIRYIGVQAD